MAAILEQGVYVTGSHLTHSSIKHRPHKSIIIVWRYTESNLEAAHSHDEKCQTGRR